MLRMHEIALPGLISNFNTFLGEYAPDHPSESLVVCRQHGNPPLLYYFTESSLSKKMPPPPRHGKILKKGSDKISNKVVYACVLCKQSGREN